MSGGSIREITRSDLLASQTRLVSAARSVDLREPPDEVPPAPAAPRMETEPALDPLRPLVGRVAVITGGGDPVGRAIALALLDAGARVCVLGPEVDDLKATTSDADPAAPILYLQCDLGSLADVSGAADFIERFDRPVDVLVHAASCRVAQGAVEGVVADLDEQYLVNLRGPYVLTQHLVPQLREGPGDVVFVTRDLGSGAGDVQHAMTTAGLPALASALRDELAEDGVRVSVIRASGEDELDPSDLADCVLGAVEMPRRIEIGELRVRAT
jgi:NAD(P)-dependent dehydrogenase (short-subunit alcohol dehydrogenase family)